MRLMLVEDDEVIARELVLRWQQPSWSVQAVGSLAAASEVLLDQRVDVIVLDLGLPDGDGLEWLARLREKDRSTPVLALTARDQVSDRVRGLRSGADDYLVKPFSADELDARIELLARRAQVANGDIAHHGRLSWIASEGCAHVAGRKLDLSPREFEVLGLLIRNAPRLLTKRVLMDALAERNLEVGDSAAEVYVSRLRRKLAGSGSVIQTLRGFGYVLEFDEADIDKPGPPA